MPIALDDILNETTLDLAEGALVELATRYAEAAVDALRTPDAVKTRHAGGFGSANDVLIASTARLVSNARYDALTRNR